MRDIFTDLTAGSEPFTCPGMPEDTAAHCGMLESSISLILGISNLQFPHDRYGDWL